MQPCNAIMHSDMWLSHNIIWIIWYGPYHMVHMWLLSEAIELFRAKHRTTDTDIFGIFIFLTVKIEFCTFNCRNSYRNKKWSMIILSHQPRLRINILFHIYRRSFFQSDSKALSSMLLDWSMNYNYHNLWFMNNGPWIMDL